ncbi:MAG: hypothetical protein M0R06_01550 [Sphaerochaeta sp.]|jgi:hypothetical protein|nr:hypothetical protein [Sphaerochaeta sp.]
MTALINLSDVRNELDLDSTETQFDTRLTDLIADIVAEAETEMEVRLEAVTDEIIYLDGGASLLFIPHLNVTKVSIVEDVDRVFTSIDPVDPSYYTINQKRGTIKKDQGKFVSGNQVLKVTYDGGYSSSSLPSDIKRALIVQTAYRWRRRKDPGLTAVSFPDGSINKYTQDEWLPSVKQVLGRYGRLFL